MSDRQQPRPALLSARRRFGRCEPFRRFDHVASHASVATFSIGTMTVDCQFLFEKSQWGVLGKSRFPAGIIYMDLNFGPPQGCKVKSATVTVTLDEYDECLDSYKTQTRRGRQKPACPVQMTDCYGPRHLVGEEKSTEFKQTMSLAPEIHVLGGGASGVGVNAEKAFKSSSRWSFNGQLLPSKGLWTYKTLKWDLTYNELESQSYRSNCVHTAFSFQHGGQPFLMKVEIEGKLGWSQRFKSKFKFGSSNDKEESQTRTLIDFRESEPFQKRLDELAKSLPRAMELENYQDIPIEIPDTAVVSFQPIPTEAEDFANCESESPPGGVSKRQPLHGATPLETPTVLQGRQTQAIEAPPDPTAPTAENMIRVFRRMTRPVEQEIIGQPPESSVSSTSSTVVAPEEEQEQMTCPTDETKPHLTLNDLNPDQEAMLKLLQVPALLTFLQLIAALMNMLPGPRKPKTTTS
ncbi:hypothetical protein Neosp_012279 [[Neocosmospora] mangrovei]